VLSTRIRPPIASPPLPQRLLGWADPLRSYLRKATVRPDHHEVVGTFFSLAGPGSPPRPLSRARRPNRQLRL
jgi:hypothetical protein